MPRNKVPKEDHMAKKESDGKKFMIVRGGLLDDGTVDVVTVNGKHLFDTATAEKILSGAPRDGEESLLVFELRGEYKAMRTWCEK
jgi:hypothetical protein